MVQVKQMTHFASPFEGLKEKENLKMDGENNGKPYFLMHALGVPIFFGNTQILCVPNGSISPR